MKKKNTDINYDDWAVRIIELEFADTSSSVYSTSWNDEELFHGSFHPERKKCNFYPHLFHICASYAPNAIPEARLSHKSKELQKTFNKFFSKGLESIVLNTSIVAKPCNSKGYLHFTFSPKNHCFIPKKPEKYPLNYEFLIPKYWTKNKIYKQYRFYKDENGKKQKDIPLNYETEIIYASIWKSYCLLENRPTITQIKFVWMLLNSTFLNTDSIDKNYIKQPMLKTYKILYKKTTL